MSHDIEVLLREKKRLESEKFDVGQSIDSLERSDAAARDQLVRVLGQLKEIENALSKLQR